MVMAIMMLMVIMMIGKRFLSKLPKLKTTSSLCLSFSWVGELLLIEGRERKRDGKRARVKNMILLFSV